MALISSSSILVGPHISISIPEKARLPIFERANDSAMKFRNRDWWTEKASSSSRIRALVNECGPTAGA